MYLKISFFGHSRICNKSKVCNRLMLIIEDKIKQDYLHFIIGVHGDFDKMALYCCRELRRKYPQIIIDIVITSINWINKNKEYNKIDYYDKENIISYPIEDVHFKRKITISNRYMVKDSDLIICYVDFNRFQSGAKTAVNYAKQISKPIINLYKEDDYILI